MNFNLYDWFKIFNYDAFIATGLASRTYTLDLENVGQKDILVTLGNLVSMTYEGVMLSINLNSKNPFEFEGYAVYLNTVTNDVYLGILIP